MTQPSNPSGRSGGALWLIGTALATIAVCLVVLVFHTFRPESQPPFDPKPDAELPAEPLPAPAKPAIPTNPKPRLVQVVKKPAAQAVTPPSLEQAPPEELPVLAPAVVVSSPPVPVVSGGGLAQLNPATDGVGATITGQVTLKGTPPPEVFNTSIAADPNCGKLHTQPVKTQFYVVSTNGGLANVFVFIRNGLEDKRFRAPSTPVLIDQVACEYQPYVTAAMVGQPIYFKNSDPVLHNIHSTPISRHNKESNKAQPAGGPILKLSFDAPEFPVRVKCDVHPWMFTYVFVSDHPYFAVTDKDGRFTIKDVPPGKYLLEAFHIKTHRDKSYGVSQPVVVTENQTLEINFVVDLTATR